MSGLFSQPFAKGKFPPFEKYAPWRRQRHAQRQSPKQQIMIVKQLHAAFGGTLTIKGKVVH